MERNQKFLRCNDVISNWFSCFPQLHEFNVVLVVSFDLIYYWWSFYLTSISELCVALKMSYQLISFHSKYCDLFKWLNFMIIFVWYLQQKCDCKNNDTIVIILFSIVYSIRITRFSEKIYKFFRFTVMWMTVTKKKKTNHHLIIDKSKVSRMKLGFCFP